MIVNRKVSVELNEKEKDAFRTAHAVLMEIAELVGGTCRGCPLSNYCGGKPECPDVVIEDVFVELTGEAI